ncbi:unnamed protein product [Malus baccata var. baccata]
MLTMETKSQTAVSHASLDPVLMDTNIQTRPPQGGEPPMEAGVDWRSQLQSESRHRIVAKMEAVRKPLEAKKESLQVSVYANNPNAQEKLHKLKDYELEKESILFEIRKRRRNFLNCQRI